MRTILAVLTLGILSMAGCSDSPAGPTSGTRVEAVVRDTPSSSPAATGTLAGNVSASLWNGNAWIELGSPNGITIPLQIPGRTTTVHGETSVAADSYSRVRLVFQGATARVASGSVVGGTTITSDSNVALGGSDQRVEMIVSVSGFSVEADANVRQLITFDLRSHQWLAVAAIQAGRVEDDAMQSAVTASVERR